MVLKRNSIPIILSLSLSFASLLMALIVYDHLFLSFSFEIAFLSLVFSLTLLLIQILQRGELDIENIFVCGLAKPPYLESKSVYRFNVRRMIGKSYAYLVYLTLILSFIALIIIRLKMGVF